MGSDRSEQHEPWTPDAIERQLSGQLTCIRCGYDLRGLSITGTCPECSMPIKATLLAVVDPKAEELAPLDRPRLTAVGLQLWAVGALAGALLIWADRLVALYGLPGVGLARWLTPAIFASLAVSMLGGLTLIRPHAGMAGGRIMRGVAGAACYLPFIYCLWRLGEHTGGLAAFSAETGTDQTVRTLWRLGANLSIAGIILGLRPSAYRLALRSVVVREGRVDRQHLYALIGALGVAALGDLIVLSGLASHNDWARSGVLVLIVLGSALFTLGLALALRDTLRLYPVIAARPVGLGDLLETNAAREKRRSNQPQTR